MSAGSGWCGPTPALRNNNEWKHFVSPGKPT
ncbi:hypothetical protein FAES_1610 [Fibrella aestuarina BUZ 2]|uniref:Uncharacterized protein n=1 Tax=Fibrella aestuarina BUZ 2 TaxID=1166018 RepID=I0K667_9BACT|nr:hypothetical protein FAES_1610 [Fibrella aestuarina BUZ 2]